MIESQIICDFRGTLIDITCANGHGRQKGVHLIEEKLLWIPAYDLSKSEQQILSLICLVVLLSTMSSTHFPIGKIVNWSNEEQNMQSKHHCVIHTSTSALPFIFLPALPHSNMYQLYVHHSHFYQRFAFHISTSTASFKYVPAVHTSFTPLPALCLSYSYQHCVIETCTSRTYIIHTSTTLFLSYSYQHCVLETCTSRTYIIHTSTG